MAVVQGAFAGLLWVSDWTCRSFYRNLVYRLPAGIYGLGLRARISGFRVHWLGLLTAWNLDVACSLQGLKSSFATQLGWVVRGSLSSGELQCRSMKIEGYNMAVSENGGP